MTAISTYTQMIRNFGMELDASDKEYIKTIIINIMSLLDISIVPTEILTMVDEDRRKELLPKITEVIYFGDEINGQIIDANGNTVCNLHQENIDPDVLIPLSSSLIKEGTELQELDNRDEINALITVIESLSQSIDKKPLMLAKLKAQALLLTKRAYNITDTIDRNNRYINQTLAANEQLKGLLINTKKERKAVLDRIDQLENQSVKQAK